MKSNQLRRAGGAFLSLAMLAALGTFTTGCELVLLVAAVAEDDDGDPPDCFDCGAPPPPSLPPTLSVSIPEWPPIGPDGSFDVTATGSDLSSINAYFRNSVLRNVPAGVGTYQVSFFGDELGEGLGPLTLEAQNRDGAYTRQAVDNFLVDLSPPTAYFDTAILPASGGQLQFFIADAWVVSEFALQVGNTSFSGKLDPGYPETFGTEWDYSLVSIPSHELPLGIFAGELTVWDAAGNSAVLTLPVTVDGIPPTALLSSPSEGATVTGLFAVTFSGQDDLPNEVSLELRVGGALIATALGPSATVTLDAADLPEGAAVISCRSVDAAGNLSAPSSVNVTVVH